MTGTLASLVSSWPADLRFDPENEQEEVPIQTLPDELLMLVLRKLDQGIDRLVKGVLRKMARAYRACAHVAKVNGEV